MTLVDIILRSALLCRHIRFKALMEIVFSVSQSQFQRGDIHFGTLQYIYVMYFVMGSVRTFLKKLNFAGSLIVSRREDSLSPCSSQIDFR